MLLTNFPIKKWQVKKKKNQQLVLVRDRQL